MVDEMQTDACLAEFSGPVLVTSAVRVGDLNWMSVISILAIFVAFDFLICPVGETIDEGTAVAVLYGGVIAQFVVLSVWATCGRLSYLVGPALWSAVAALLFGVFALGTSVTRFFRLPLTFREVLSLCLCMPLLLLIAQVPVALFWFFSGRRRAIGFSAENSRPGMARQFTIYQMLEFTTHVALALGLMAAGTSLVGYHQTAMFHFKLLASGGWIAITNLLVGVPVLWAVLYAKKKERAGLIVLAASAVLGVFVAGLYFVWHPVVPQLPGVILYFVGASMLAAAIPLGVLHVTFKKHEPQDEPRREPLAMATQEAVSTSPADTDLFSS